MKKIYTCLLVVMTAFLVTACGPRVEVPTASVAKIKGTEGYKEGTYGPSKFRLDSCWWPGAVCDQLVVLSSADFAHKEEFNLFMPKDRLNLDFTIGMTLSINPKSHDMLFNKIGAKKSGTHTSMISVTQAYKIYAQKIIRSRVRGFMADYAIMDISSNRTKIGSELENAISEEIEAKTPFIVRFLDLDEVDYPPLIVEAQEKAAERREQINQENAELEVAKVRYKRQLEEATMKRKVDIEKAEAEAEVNRILGKSVTDSYVVYRQLNALDKISESDNNKYIPVEMLGSMATQVMLGNNK